jgi:integrase
MVLSEDEVARFLAAAQDHRLYALFLLVVTLGLRQGEAFALHWDDLDFSNRVLHVRHTLQELKADLSLVEPKTERSRRTLELPEHLVEALEAHRDRMMKGGIEGQWVFCDSQGGPLRKSNFLRRDYYPLLEQSGIDRAARAFTFHDLRHTAATLMLSRGVPLLEVSEILGHEDEGFTLRTYAHVLPSMRRAATQKIEGFFRELLRNETPIAT